MDGTTEGLKLEVSRRPFPGWLDWVSLVGLSFAIFLGKAYDHTLHAMDSSTYARLSLDATRLTGIHLPIGDLRTGEGFWPTGFNDHPFTLIWLSGKVMRFLGPDAFSARLLAGLFAVVTLLALYRFGTHILKSRAAGIIGALFLLSTPMYISSGAKYQLDPALLAGIAISFLGYFSSSIVLTWIGIAIAVWIKGPLGFLVFPSVFIAILATSRHDRTAWKKFFLYASSGIAIGSLVWVAIGTFGSWSLVGDYWGRWVFGQVVKNSYSPNLATFAFILRRNFLWLLWIVLIGRAAYRGGFLRRLEFVAPAAGTLIVFFLVLSMRAKYEHYYMPCFLLLSICGMIVFRDWAERRARGVRTTLYSMAMIVPAFLLGTPTPLGTEKFPQLRAWIPFIQSHGTCRDRIVLVEDEVPYGSGRDYAAVLQFYTNRHTSGVAGCDGLREAVSASPPPTWIILDEGMRKTCAANIPGRYFPEFRYGNQVLLGPVDLRTSAVDLSFLQGTLNAVADCETPVWKATRYFRPVRNDGHESD